MVKSTARRRSAGEGSTFQRKDRPGWRGRVMETRPDGKRIVHQVSGATQKEARDRLDDLRKRLRLGASDPQAAGTVGEYLSGWIERHRDHVRASSWATAEMYVRCYLVPALGRIPLARLTAADVDRALGSFRRAGRPTTGHDGRAPRPVAPVTVNHVRATLRRALNDARKAGLVSFNAAADSKPQRGEAHAIAYLEPDALNRLLAATADDPLGPMWALAASTGLRRGELLGLRWTDVDLQTGSLTVKRSVARNEQGGWSAGETKFARSRRSLPLPAMARNALNRQRKRQAAARLAAGSSWQAGDDGYIFTDAVGRALLPEYVSHAFGKARDKAGLPDATLHQLRHTAATLLLAEGVPLIVVSEWLGHSAIGITASAYAAVVPKLHQEAAAAMDRALSGGA